MKKLNVSLLAVVFAVVVLGGVRGFAQVNGAPHTPSPPGLPAYLGPGPAGLPAQQSPGPAGMPSNPPPGPAGLPTNGATTNAPPGTTTNAPTNPAGLP